mgnify:CR=1 FL=1
MFKTKTFSVENKKKVTQIKIARVDTEKAWDFIETDNLWTYEDPSIAVFFEGRYYPYDNTYEDPKYLLQFINKLLHPVLILKTESDMDKFMNNTLAPVENTKFFKKYTASGEVRYLLTDSEMSSWKYKTRALTLMFEKNDYDEELNAIKMAGRYLANRLDLRIALMADKKVIKKLKRDSSWFENSSSFTSLVLKRYDDTIFISDLMNDEELTRFKTPFADASINNEKSGYVNKYSVWINKLSIKLIEPMNS